MSERWKPEINDVYYWIVDFGYTREVRSVRWINDKIDNMTYKSGNCFRTEAEARSAAEKVKVLLLSLHDNGTSTANSETLKDKPLPKLTAEVFDRPDCPEWAKYAVVDVQGLAYWYQHPPLADERIGVWEAWWNRRQLIDGFFDKSDWQNSLIERPAKLPDWCKPGEWVFDKAINEYSQVAAEDTTEHLQEVCKIIAKGEIMEARLRPYNAKEMLGLVGKVVTRKDGDVFLVTSYTPQLEKDLCAVEIDNMLVTPDGVLFQYTINNKPAGVLEHLENGEWVK